MKTESPKQSYIVSNELKGYLYIRHSGVARGGRGGPHLAAQLSVLIIYY